MKARCIKGCVESRKKVEKDEGHRGKERKGKLIGGSFKHLADRV